MLNLSMCGRVVRMSRQAYAYITMRMLHLATNRYAGLH